MTPYQRQIVEDILTLHRFCEPAETIAGKLHLPLAVVRYVVQHGTLPPVSTAQSEGDVQ